MAKFSTVAFTLALLFVCSYADPLFLLSSQKIADLSDNVFLDTQGVNNLLNNKILGTESAPNAVFVFNVKVQDKKYLENPSLLLQEVSKHSALKNHFKASSNSFSSLYVKDAFAKTFNNDLKNTFVNKNYQLLHLALKNFNLDTVRHFKSASGDKILSITELSMNELKGLDLFFQKHFNGLTTLSHNKFLVVLKFTNETDAESQVHVNLQTAARMLEEEDAEKENTESTTPTPAPVTPTTTTTPKATGTPIKISPEGFSGFVIAIVLVLFLYAGFQIMSSIKPPVGFNKVQLLIGKEH